MGSRGRRREGQRSGARVALRVMRDASRAWGNCLASAIVAVCALWPTPTVWALSAKTSVEQASSPVMLVPVVTSGLRSPLFVTHAGDRSGRLFVVEQPGRIRVVQGSTLVKTPFLDISDLVDFGGERGLLGLAFHPEYTSHGRLFVNYSRSDDGATIVAEYKVSRDPNRAEQTGDAILTVQQPYGNHNGGMLAFGRDGYLYVGMGDGGAGGDPGNRAQNKNTLLGKILRLDVDSGKPYAIPRDNLYAKGGGRPEIFASGFRNPWRFSFDRKSGQLWVADVGQNAWEEVHVVRGGSNYGWRIMEGAHCYSPPRSCPTEHLELPVVEYAHERGRCSITGGYVYRGEAVPSLHGTYIFGDYCSGDLFSFSGTAGAARGTVSQPAVLLETDLNISSLGEDQVGELYVVDHAGGIYKIVPSSVQSAR